MSWILFILFGIVTKIHGFCLIHMAMGFSGPLVHFVQFVVYITFSVGHWNSKILSTCCSFWVHSRILLLVCIPCIINHISLYTFYLQDYYVNWSYMCCFLYERVYWWVVMINGFLVLEALEYFFHVSLPWGILLSYQRHETIFYILLLHSFWISRFTIYVGLRLLSRSLLNTNIQNLSS